MWLPYIRMSRPSPTFNSASRRGPVAPDDARGGPPRLGVVRRHRVGNDHLIDGILELGKFAVRWRCFGVVGHAWPEAPKQVERPASEQQCVGGDDPLRVVCVELSVHRQDHDVAPRTLEKPSRETILATMSLRMAASWLPEPAELRAGEARRPGPPRLAEIA